MLTEKEASERWCPFVGARFITATPPASDKCIGSRCMAWRWIEDGDEDVVYNQTEKPSGDGWQPYSDSPSNCAWKRPRPAGERKGYCGLAGQAAGAGK